jgi:hypothetical protein
MPQILLALPACGSTTPSPGTRNDASAGSPPDRLNLNTKGTAGAGVFYDVLKLESDRSPQNVSPAISAQAR